MIEELIGRVFATRNATHLAHWAANGAGSFARHAALGEFYDELIDKIDNIVEMYQGAFGLIGEVNIPDTPVKAVMEHIGDEANWIEEHRKEIACDVCAIENMLDELAGLYLKTFYKLKNLS